MKFDELLIAKLNNDLKTKNTDALEDYRLQEEVNELMLDEHLNLKVK